MSDPNHPQPGAGDPRDANTPHGGPAPDGGVPVPQATPADQGAHQSQAFQQTPYPQSSRPDYSTPNENPPGKTLGIVAIPVAVFFSVIGIILGFVAKSQSKKVGYKNTPATVAIVVGFITLVLSIISIIAAVALLGAASSELMNQVCEQLGTGTHEIGG